MRIEVVRLAAAPGRWRERNRLLEATEADVLAFLDDDVQEPEGWRERLEAAWAQAAPGVAAIGGPVALSSRPLWAGPDLDAVLGALDHGPEPRELDPRSATLVAGNLSFRVWQLAAIGGFKEPPADRGDRDWFAEEHEAQRELGRWGWRILYEPGLRVERAPDARLLRVIRSRYRYGARQGRAGSRERGPALRQAASSGAGLIPAMLRRDRPTATERAVRAAENLGTALARAGRARRPPAPGRGAAILLYHRVAERDPDPLGLCVTPRHFEEQLEVLGDRVVPLGELVDRMAPGSVAITFDDGYIDNLGTAPASATVFAATGHIESGRPFFWDELTRLLRHDGRLELDVAGERREWDDMRQAWYDLHHLLQPRSPELIEAVLEQLRERAGAGAAAPEDRPMTPAELRELAATAAIGAHTRRHVSLRFQPLEVQRAEIEGSRDDVAEWTGTVPEAFSYPFGIPHRDFVRRTAQIVRDAGFRFAVGNHAGLVTRDSDTWGLPRLTAPNVGGDEFAAWLRAQGVR